MSHASSSTAMDASTLSALIESSSAELAELHARLGNPREELEEAINALRTSIHEAISAQVRTVKTHVADVEAECARLEASIELLSAATGHAAAPPPQNGPGGVPRPLLTWREELGREETRLQGVYRAELARCAALQERIRALNAQMSNACELHDKQPTVGTVGEQTLHDVSSAWMLHLEQHLEHAQHTYNERRLQLEAQLAEILQLWSELHIAPSVEVRQGVAVPVADAGSDATRAEESAFHAAILRYAQQVPEFTADGRFEGTFVPAAEAAPGAAADGSTFLAETPTRASEPRRASGLQLGAGAPAEEADLLQPTDEVLHQSGVLRAAMEQEKTERESKIQAYYDELCELWMRFDVPEAEMDAFVLDHRGSTLDVVDAYKSELDKMRVLKSQHMSLFILKTRELIQEQWDALFLSDTERESAFPAFFLELPDSEAPGADSAVDWDSLLQQHEQMTARLADQLEKRAPLLRLVARYREICDEERALEESANDGSRLLGRGNRGDPGRLLREEKMRKRVKVQKPKIEQELLRVIPAWEAEQGTPFLMDGVRFVDQLQEQRAGAKENVRAARPGTAMGGDARRGAGATSALGHRGAPPSGARGAPAPSRPAQPASGVRRPAATPAPGARRGAAPSGARPRGGAARTAPYATAAPAPPPETDGMWMRGGNRAQADARMPQRVATPASATSRSTSGTSTATTLQRGVSATSAPMDESVAAPPLDTPRRTPSSYLQSTLSQVKHQMHTPVPHAR